MKLYKNKEWLISKYWTEEKTLKEISELCNCNASCVYKNMKKLEIGTRDNVDAQELRFRERNSTMKHTNKEWLMEEYVNKKGSLGDIAKEVGCSRNNIFYWCNKLGIDRRTSVEGTKLRIFSDDALQKMSEHRKFFKGEKNYWYGKKKPWMSENQRGDKNPCWRGGRFPYYGPNWKAKREQALIRDSYICSICGVIDRKRTNSIHHIVGLRKFYNLILDCYDFYEKVSIGVLGLIPCNLLIPNIIWEEANDLSNLETLCSSCHMKLERSKQYIRN